jgi:hypothetical protein
VNKTPLYLLVVIAVLLSIAIPSLADGPGTAYVDTSYDGNEEGSEGKPYDTEDEGEAYLQSLPDGGYLYTKNADGTWSEGRWVDPVRSGAAGVPLPKAVFYILLAILALGLSLAGWRVLRRSQRTGG